jgi:hypothetical protein
MSRKVYPAPPDPSTLVERVHLYMMARERGDDLREVRNDIIDILMDTRKIKTYEDLMRTRDKEHEIPYSLFFFAAVVWNDDRLVKAVISTAKRIGVLNQLKRTRYGSTQQSVVSMTQGMEILDELERNDFGELRKSRKQSRKKKRKQKSRKITLFLR